MTPSPRTRSGLSRLCALPGLLLALGLATPAQAFSGMMLAQSKSEHKGITMNQAQLDGITKARLSANIAQVSAGNLYPDDAAYIAKVCADANLSALPIEAADSYAAQYAGKTILEPETELAAAITATSALPNPPDLPPPTIAGVPQEVTMRQARLALLVHHQHELDHLSSLSLLVKSSCDE